PLLHVLVLHRPEVQGALLRHRHVVSGLARARVERVRPAVRSRDPGDVRSLTGRSRAAGARGCERPRRAVGSAGPEAGVGSPRPTRPSHLAPRCRMLSVRRGLSIVRRPRRARGGMAEWFKATLLKTVERKLRGFESYSLRQSWSGGRVAEGSRLL